MHGRVFIPYEAAAEESEQQRGDFRQMPLCKLKHTVDAGNLPLT